MDNKAYLDEIAVKGKKKFSSGPFLTPVMMKLIIVGAIAVIVMVIVGTMLGSRTEDVSSIHASVYARINSIMAEEGPIEFYYERLKASELRSYASALIASLTTTKTKIDSISSNIGLDVESLPAEAVAENETQMSEYMAELEDAYLNGVLDITYASSTSYQLTLLIGLETQARSKTNDPDYAEALDNSISDLTKLQKSFKNYSDTH